MSKLILSAAIRGAHGIVKRVEGQVKDAIEKFGADKKVELPNTGYYLPVIYGILGEQVSTLGDMTKIIERCKKLLPPEPSENLWFPYLGAGLDAGMVALWAFEIEETLKYLEDPIPYLIAEDSTEDHLWLGAADDIILRKRGVEFVDGSAPGFAAIVGAAPDSKTAAKLAKELQEKNLYVFMAGCNPEGVTFSEQLREEGVQLGWNTRLVPFGPKISAAIHAVGFATRAALAFGGVEPGDYARVLKYNKDRIFAFVLALGEVGDEDYAAAAGVINYGFPTIADTNIPQVLPTGVCTYEHVVSNVSYDDMVAKAIEVRGLKINITDIPIPVSYGSAFEGERIKKEDMHVELAGPKAPGCELVTMKDSSEVKDGHFEVIGPNLADIESGSRIPLAIMVEVSGRKMQSDFEPILERQIHHLLNGAEGVLHIGQRDIIWMRVSKKAKDAGFDLSHFGSVIHAKFHSEYGNILDKVQVKIYTDEAKVNELLDNAHKVYAERDARLKGLSDDSVETFYSCTLCQSFAPTHLCIISPERPGLCGAYSWLDGKAAFEITPTGPNQPVEKGNTLDEVMGQWDGVNAFIAAGSGGAVEKFNAYSMMEDPMTSCGCFEAIAVLLPMANGIMVVDRDFSGMTPCGMQFSTLAGSVGGGLQTPGFVGISKLYVASKKFISADGGLARLAWLPKHLKEFLKDHIAARAEEDGLDDFVNKIATEEDCTTEEEVMEFMTKVNHPALTMDPMF